jgi:hypothetical protein
VERDKNRMGREHLKVGRSVKHVWIDHRQIVQDRRSGNVADAGQQAP